jgi:hypothetical protein
MVWLLTGVGHLLSLTPSGKLVVTFNSPVNLTLLAASLRFAGAPNSGTNPNAVDGPSLVVSRCVSPPAVRIPFGPVATQQVGSVD